MKYLASAVAALTLAACGAPEPAPAPTAAPASAPAPTPPAAAAAASIDLAGDWAVVEVVASPPEPGTPVIKVAITADRLRAQSQCKHYWWTYRQSGEAFDATAEPYPDAMCERTDSYWEQFFVEAIERADRVVLQPDGAVLITGPGGQVLLRPA